MVQTVVFNFYQHRVMGGLLQRWVSEAWHFSSFYCGISQICSQAIKAGLENLSSRDDLNNKVKYLEAARKRMHSTGAGKINMKASHEKNFSARLQPPYMSGPLLAQAPSNLVPRLPCS